MSRVFAPEGTDSWDAPNPYYSPERCGLETVVHLEDDEPYQYDTILVVRDIETGGLYAAHDSGCSCPTPFEEFKSLEQFIPITTEDDFTRLVREHDSGYSGWKPSDVLDAARKVREALRS